MTRRDITGSQRRVVGNKMEDYVHVSQVAVLSQVNVSSLQVLSPSVPKRVVVGLRVIAVVLFFAALSVTAFDWLLDFLADFPQLILDVVEVILRRGLGRVH